MPIQVEHLTHTYMPGSPFSAVALNDVSLTIEDGELIGLLGHTGSGKTTLVQHLNGLIKPTSGRVVVDGLDLTQKGVSLLEVRKKVGLVFQYPEYQLFEETVAKDIAFGPRNMGLDAEEIDRRVRGAMLQVGLNYDEVAERSPFELSGGQSETVSRLKARVHDRESGALEEAEAALRRWPNCFEVAYYAAENYDVRGISSGDAGLLRRALELYRRACRLIAQNQDPDISETTLYRAMAGVHISLGEPEKGIELLKAHNPCQLNDALIGKTLAADADDPDAAEQHLTRALLDLAVTHMQVVTGYVNVYFKRGDYDGALALLDWALAFYPGLAKPGEPNFLNKGEAALLAIRAEALMQLGNAEGAGESLRRARDIALRFDAAPSCDVTRLRFVAPDTVASSVDDLAETALAGVEKFMAELEHAALSALWEKERREE
mgnify:CR=1 FL=1